MTSPVETTISWTTLFRILVVALGLYLIWHLSQVIIVVLLSLVLAAALYPAVRFIRRKLSLSLPIASILIVVLLFLPIILVISTMFQIFIDQAPGLITTLNQAVQNSTVIPESFKQIDLTQYSQTGANYLVSSTSKVTNIITNFFAIIFLTLYLLIDSQRLSVVVTGFIPASKRATFQLLFNQIAAINGQYIRGNLLISLVCGLTISAGLLIMQVPYALLLGIFAGLVDLLPLVGAIIGMVPAIIIAFSVSPTIGFLVLALFIIYQQFENNILAPNIYNKALDLSPALSFIAVIIGGNLFGVAGAFMALPLAASIPTVVRFLDSQNTK